MLISRKAALPKGFRSGELLVALNYLGQVDAIPIDKGRSNAIEVAYLAGRLSTVDSRKKLQICLRSTDPSILAWTYCGLATLAIDACEFTEAQRLLNAAVEQSNESGEVTAQCEAHLRMISLSLNIGGPIAALALAKTTERIVAASGDVHAFALLRIRLAEVDARRGLLESALQHLDSSLELLAQEPEYVLEGVHWLDRAAVEHYLGRSDRALNAALETARVAKKSGHFRHAIAAKGNEALTRLQLGDLAAAESAFDRIPDAIRAFPQHFLAVLDGKSELRLLQGRLDDADTALAEIAQLVEGTPTLKTSWQHLAATESRVRLLHRRGFAEEAVRLALDAEGDAVRRSDRLLQVSHGLVRSAVLIDVGRSEEATVALKDLVLHREELSRAEDLELDRLLGEHYAREQQVELAHDHVLRAIRLQDFSSSATTRLCLQRTAETVGLQPVVPAGSPVQTSPLPQEPPLHPITLKSVEQLFHLARIPEMLGREVLSMLLRASCVSDARIDSTLLDSQAAEPQETPERVLIPLGTFLGRRYRIDARVKPGIQALETVVTIRALVSSAVSLRTLKQKDENRSALWRFEPVASADSPLVVSPTMQQLLATIHSLAATDIPVLLTGETGTGKEVFARELHRASGARGPFVPFNCTAVAADMLDAQLFGYRRGAFTGATDNFSGTARSAQDGTLFLDEIGELGIDLQPKLLRLLDRFEVHPLGEAHPVAVRTRLVAATNANLKSMIAAGRFREDLFYRLNVGHVEIPPLRERREEVPPLADHFLDLFARQNRRGRLSLGDDAVEALLLYRWPGNVRELASEMRRLVTFCKPGSVVRARDLSADIQVGRQAWQTTAGASPENGVTIALDQPLDIAVEAVERAVVRFALDAEGGHLERAAQRLAISRKGLFLKRRRLGLDAWKAAP